MPVDQLWNDLWTTTGGGIALIVTAIALRAFLPNWTWLRAVVMIAGGIVVIRLMAYVLGTAIANKDDTGWLQKGIHAAAWALGLIPAVGGVLRRIIDVIGTNLTWIFAAVLVVWTLVHMFPRVWKLLSRRAGWGGRGGEDYDRDLPRRGGRVATLSSADTALHAARHHTTWVALLVPAAVALVPPLAAAWNMGGQP